MADWIIVVDDDTSNLKVAGHILSKAGMRVTALKSGRIALDYIRKNIYDCVVLDIMMPRMDGFVLLHNMRHKDELKDIPVVVVSSVFEADTLEKAKNLGAQGYIVKSDFERESLTAKVKELLHE